MASRILKWGNGLGVLIPMFAAKGLGLKAGSEVRLLVLENEIRIRPLNAGAAVADGAPEPSRAEQVKAMLSRW